MGHSYDTVVSHLLERIPGLRQFQGDFEEDIPYDVFGFVGSLLRDRREELDALAIPVDDVFGFLQELIESGDLQLVNLAEVAVFELLTDTPESVAFARSRLRAAALEHFERVLSGWRKES